MIRVNDRNLSQLEYENTFGKIYRYLTMKLEHIPVRWQRFFGDPFVKVLNQTYIAISDLTFLFEQGKGQSAERYGKCAEVIDLLGEIINFSYTYWNLSSSKKGKIKYVPPETRKYLTDMINKELALVVGVMKKCNKGQRKEPTIPHMYVITKQEIEKVEFLKKLADLEKLIYRKANNSSKRHPDACVEMLVGLSRSALYNASQGNKVKVDNDESKLKKRKMWINKALNDLYNMNKPVSMLSYDNFFTEGELRDISGYVTESIKLLTSIKNADQKAFEELDK